LDAACGCGYGSSILNEKCVVTGVDIAERAIRHAEEFFPGPEYILGDVADSPWRGRFSGIVSFETLEHLKDPKPVLESFRRSLNGYFIASVPNENLYPFDPQVFKNDEYPHQRHYRPEQFDALFEDAGFTVISRWCQESKSKPEIKEGTEGRFLIYVGR
jgi:SAM-dependent methyltransferase